MEKKQGNNTGILRNSLGIYVVVYFKAALCLFFFGPLRSVGCWITTGVRNNCKQFWNPLCLEFKKCPTLRPPIGNIKKDSSRKQCMLITSAIKGTARCGFDYI